MPTDRARCASPATASIAPRDPDPRGMAGDRRRRPGRAAPSRTLWVDRSEPQIRYLEVERRRRRRKPVLVPMTLAAGQRPAGARSRSARSLAHQFADAPDARRARTRSPSSRRTRSPPTSPAATSTPTPAALRAAPVIEPHARAAPRPAGAVCRRARRLLWQGSPAWRALARRALPRPQARDLFRACCSPGGVAAGLADGAAAGAVGAGGPAGLAARWRALGIAGALSPG